jgi:hypothetical protein
VRQPCRPLPAAHRSAAAEHLRIDRHPLRVRLPEPTLARLRLW